MTVGEVLAVLLGEHGAPPSVARGFIRTIAGSELNVAVALSRLGANVSIATCLGRDSLGDAVAGALEREMLTAAIRRVESPTGVLLRGANGAGAMHLRHASAATELTQAEVDGAWNEPDAVFLSGITAVRSPSACAAVVHAARRARDEGALVVIDPNYRPALGSRTDFARALRPLRTLADIAIGDLDELADLAGTEPRDAVPVLLESGCRLVITKRGADGAIAYDGTTDYEVRSLASTVVDTVGAGDAFAAGVLFAAARGLSVPASLQLGSTLAAHVVETLGDIQGLPYLTPTTSGAGR